MSSKVCDSQLKDFLSFLQVERGLAQNTVDSYRYDLEQYAFFLKDKGLSFLEATQSIIFNFLNYQREQNLSARTDPVSWRRSVVYIAFYYRKAR